jgi:hypothetical protein
MNNLIAFHVGHKVNFVDADNNFVGFDTEQNCCEDARYGVKPLDGNDIEDLSEINKWLSDNHAVRIGEGCNEIHLGKYDDVNDRVEFPILGGDCWGPKLIGHIFFSNSHNGYYSHGWGRGLLVESKSGGL